MATYEELRTLDDNDSLKNRIDVAVMIAANSLLEATPTIDEQKWAAAVFASPRAESIKVWRAVLAKNSSATVAQIMNATDAALQTKANEVVPSLVVAFNAV